MPYRPQITDIDSIGVYHLNMSVLKYDFSGILVFNQLNDSSFRVVLTSEMGPKIIDMNVFPNNYQLLFAMRQLKKKRVLNSFYNDFIAITGLRAYKKNTLVEKDDSLNTYIIKNKKEVLCVNPSKDATFTHCEFIVNEKKQWEIDYFYKDQQQVDSLFLRHHNFKLQMKLRKIKM